MTPETVDALLAEVEEEYEFDRVLPLYMFAWSLAGLKHTRSDPGFQDTCRAAYDRFVRAHPDLRLVQVPWPIDLAQAAPLPADTEIDLDLDPNSAPPVVLQALVHPDELAAG
jgi:hypothetical protein